MKTSGMATKQCEVASLRGKQQYFFDLPHHDNNYNISYKCYQNLQIT